jgi:hypothetical protein
MSVLADMMLIITIVGLITAPLLIVGAVIQVLEARDNDNNDERR